MQGTEIVQRGGRLESIKPFDRLAPAGLEAPDTLAGVQGLGVLVAKALDHLGKIKNVTCYVNRNRRLDEKSDIGMDVGRPSALVRAVSSFLEPQKGTSERFR